ncbi:MAG: hypothetical protein NZ659_02150 [Acidimicrobiales bacterium]|nr:hypothetical protein [Acidimicrobiales bacterium]
MMKKGIWKNIGRKGVYEEEACAESGVIETAKETDNGDAFGEIRMQAKRDQVRAMLDADEKAISSKAVDRIESSSALDVLALLQGAGAGALLDKPGAVSATAAPSSSNNPEPENPDSEDDDDTAPINSLQDRMHRSFGAKPAVAKSSHHVAPKAASAAGGVKPALAKCADNQASKLTSQVAASGLAFPNRAGVSARGNPHVAGASADSGAASRHEAFHLDGRAKRIVESIRGVTEREIHIGLETIQGAFTEEDGLFQYRATAVGKSGAIQKANEVKKMLTRTLATIRTSQKRVENSSVAAQQELQANGVTARLASQLNTATLQFDMVALLQEKQPVPESFLDAKRKCDADGIKFAVGIHKLELSVSAQHCMLYKRYDDFLKLLTPSGEACAKIVAHGVPHREVSDLACSLVQNCFLELLQNVKLADVHKADVTQTPVEFLQKVIDDHDKEFMGKATVPGLKMWRMLLDMDNASPEMLSELVDKYRFVLDKTKTHPILPEDASTLETYIAESKIGCKLLELADARVLGLANEIAADKLLQVVFDQVVRFEATGGVNAFIQDDGDMSSFLDDGLIHIEQSAQAVIDATCADKQVSRKPMKLLSQRLQDARSRAWEFALTSWKNIAQQTVDGAMETVVEAMANEGMVVGEPDEQGNEKYLINVDVVREALDFCAFRGHEFFEVSDPVLDLHPGRKAFKTEIANFGKFANQIWDILQCALCVSSERLRALHPDVKWDHASLTSLENDQLKRYTNTAECLQGLQVARQKVAEGRTLGASEVLTKTVRVVL